MAKHADIKYKFWPYQKKGIDKNLNGSSLKLFLAYRKFAANNKSKNIASKSILRNKQKNKNYSLDLTIIVSFGRICFPIRHVYFQCKYVDIIPKLPFLKIVQQLMRVE